MLPFFLALSIIAGLYSGDVEMSFSELIQMLKLGPWGSSEEAFKLSVIWQIRLPRIIATAASGAILAASGVAFQSVLRNPLAEPYTLGVSSGAAFGAACAIVSGVPWISGFSFLGSISALFIVWVLGERKNDPDISRIILAGVIVGSVLGAGLTLLKALAGEKVSAIIIWLMGSFSAATWWDVPPLFFALCVLLMFCASNCKEMDIMALGTNAAALGVDLSKKKLMILGGASCAVSFVVSRFGVIGFVGLVVPHLLRILFGPAHHTLLPLSLLAGGALLCLADTIAKMWNELPAGVLTVLIGGPVFCAILWNRK
jgi:iron complex transport system permease protein